jgi:FeS assembly SUF system protein
MSEETKPIDKQVLEAKVIEVLRSCYDPEIPVNIYDLGLIYEIKVEDSGAVFIRMTLTAPACPVAGSLPGEVEDRIRSIPEAADVKVELVWDPPWCSDRMSDAAKLQLNML